MTHPHTWGKWKELWEKEQPDFFRHSLLHFGFQTLANGDEERAERIGLYLEVADFCTENGQYPWKKGWEEEHPTCSVLETRESRGPSKVKLALAQKAFAGLSQNFFKNTAEERHCPSWFQTLTIPGVMEKVLWFFRLNKDQWFVNLKHDWDRENMHGKIAREFLFDVCRVILRTANWYHNSGRGVLSDHDFFPSFRPKTIGALYGLGKIDYLFKVPGLIDDECMKVLEELAMKSAERDIKIEDPDTGGRNCHRPTSIKEACLVSPAARVFFTLKTMKKEIKRLQELYRLKNRQTEIEEEMRRLSQGRAG